MLPRWPVATLLVSMLVLAPPAAADSLDPPALNAPAAGGSVKANPEFTWAPVSRAAKYRIQVSTTDAFTSITWTADVFGTAATPTTELPLGTLHWRVASLDAAGVLGPYSPSQSFTKAQADAPAPTGPADTATLDYPAQRPVLSWDPVAGMKQYQVQIDDESTFTGAASYTTSSTFFALPAALPSNAARFWRVQGVSTNPSVTTEWSNSNPVGLRSFKIAWPSAAAPTLLSPMADLSLADSLVQDTDEIEFSWTAVSGAAEYEIQTSTTPDFTGAYVTAQITDATRYRMTNTLTQDQYYWRVRALQANGEPTAWSAVRGFKREWLDPDQAQVLQEARPTITLADSDPLTLGTQLEEHGIAVTWSAVRRATYYELEISTDPTFNASLSPTSNLVHRMCKTPHTAWTPYLAGTYTGTSSTTFGPCAWTGTSTTPAATRFIVLGNTYYVRVRAVDQTPNGSTVTSLWSNAAREGEGVAPATASFTVVASTQTTTDAAQPAVPLMPLNSANLADTPMLTWQPVQGAETYMVGLARDSSFNTRVLPANTYVVTTNTELVLNQTLLDNTVGQPYFWFVLPCSRWDGVGDPDNVCSVGENQAINIPGKFASFNKLGAAVTGLAAQSTQTDTVALSWQDQLQTSPDGGGVQWYELEVRNAADVLVDSVGTDATGYTPIRKTYADGQYTWRVRAIDASGTALAWSASAPVTTAASFQKLSSVPTPLAPDPSATLPVLLWTPTSFAGSYDVEVYRGVDPAFPAGNEVASASVSGRPYPVATPATALPADTYSWRVRQEDATGKPGPWSTAVLPFTVGGTKPIGQQPADSSATATTSLVFRWSNVPGVVRYRFESSTTPGFGTISESVVTTGSSYAPTFAYKGGTAYYWRVSALNAADDTMATSLPLSFTATSPPEAPGASAAVSGATISVAWTPPANGGSALTSYVVRYRAFGATAWTELPLSADVASASLGSLPANQKYEAQVAAVNAVGTGPFSTLVSATTPVVPAVPASLKLTPTAGGFTASWSAPTAGGTPITGYVVRVARSAGGGSSETSVTGPTAVLSGLAGSTAYTVQVAAQNAVGAGPFASAEGTTLPAAAAAAPALLTLARAQTIAFGAAATLTGTLKTSTGVAIVGKTVTLVALPAGASAWASVAAVSTTAGGVFSGSVRPSRNTQYRAVFAGEAPTLAGASAAISVRVKPKISLASSAMHRRLGSTVRLSGSVLPKAAGAKVALQCMKWAHWVTTKLGTTSTAGTFRLPVKLTSRKGLTCRVALAGGPTMAAGHSPRVVLKTT